MQEQFIIMVWNFFKNPAIIAALISTVVTGFINLKNGESAKLSALYNHKYKFWLDFSKKFFRIKPFLDRMINPFNCSAGIITYQGKVETLKNFSKWIVEWNEFNELVNENEVIYMRPQEIDTLLLNCFFTSLKEHLPRLDLKENLGNIETYTIPSEFINKVFIDAKKYFDDNVREDSKLFYQYLKILDKKSKNKKSKYNEIAKFLNDTDIDNIMNKLSNEIFLELIKLNLDDISKKLEEIVSIEPVPKKIFFKIKKWWRKHKPNNFKKWLSYPYNKKQLQINKTFRIILIILLLLLVTGGLWFLSDNLYSFCGHISVIVILILLHYLFNLLFANK